MQNTAVYAPITFAEIVINRLYNVSASKGNGDPAGVRWINSDLIGFTYKMKKIEAEADTM